MLLKPSMFLHSEASSDIWPNAYKKHSIQNELSNYLNVDYKQIDEFMAPIYGTCYGCSW